MRAISKCPVGFSLLTLSILSSAQILSSAYAQVASRPPIALEWHTFTVPEFGTKVEYPAGIFSVEDGEPEKGVGQRFRSADGSSLLTIYSRANDGGETPADYLKNNLRLRRSDLDYERVTRSFFAISSSRQGLTFYSRCNFSADAGGAIHCVDLVYPQQQRRAWDDVVTRISRSLRPLEG
jgi:hypothetical protein